MHAVVPVRGIAAGVPFLLVPPTTPRKTAPVVAAWHLMDAPRTEAAFAAALPLRELDAWRLYLGLPMCGLRLPAGGVAELERLGYEDAVINLQGPIAEQGAAELPAVLDELGERFGCGGGPLGLLGGSMGAAVAQLVLVDAAGPPVAAAVLVSPLTRLRPAVEALGRQYGVTYAWTDASLAVAGRLDFVARADETVRAGQPAVRLVVGAQDDADGFRHPAEQLRTALADRYDDASRVDLVVVPAMAHALAEEPGLEPAPQTVHASAVDRHAVDWFAAHLPAEARN